MILGNFSVFSLMITDIRTDGRKDRPSYRDARTHLKKGEKRKTRTAFFPLKFLHAIYEKTASFGHMKDQPPGQLMRCQQKNF